MKKKKAWKIINETIDNFIKDQEQTQRIIIVLKITKNKGYALYYNAKCGTFGARDFDWRDTAKYETDIWKLARFEGEYIGVAKKVALEFMKSHRLGYCLYTENGVIVG